MDISSLESYRWRVQRWNLSLACLFIGWAELVWLFAFRKNFGGDEGDASVRKFVLSTPKTEGVNFVWNVVKRLELSCPWGAIHDLLINFRVIRWECNWRRWKLCVVIWGNHGYEWSFLSLRIPQPVEVLATRLGKRSHWEIYWRK